jgi:cell division protein FtsI/penicillin-binding protein 2
MCIVFGLGLGAILLRLGWVQLVRAGHWSQIAHRQSTQIVDVAAHRGRILDRHGSILAVSEHLTKVGVNHPGEWLGSERRAWLADQLGLDERDLARRLRRGRGHTVIHSEALLTPDARSQLRDRPGITLEDRVERLYPMGGTARPLIGRVNHQGRAVSGLELALDERLRGQPGKSRVRLDGGLRRDRLWTVPVQPPVNGSDVALTLDARVQMILEDELERARRDAQAHRAQAIVLDVRSSEVIGLAQGPERPAPLSDLGSLDPLRVMAAADAFEPGSTFKIFTLASLLSHGVCDTSQIFDGGRAYPGQWRVSKTLPSGLRLTDVHPVPRVSLRHAFVVSSNIIMGGSATLLEQDELYAHLRAFGFGSKLNVGLPAETAGLLHPVQRWSRRSLSTVAIGQEIAVSLLQLASAYAAVIGDGTLRAPTFTREWIDVEGRVETVGSRVIRERVVAPSLIPLLRSLCREVVELPYGTGTEARVGGLSVAGKTGTAQIPSRGSYLKGAYTTSFVGFVPADDPQLLVALALHRAPGETTYGGNTAAPAFARIVRQITASTDWLDALAVSGSSPSIPVVPAPHLIGQSAREILGLVKAGEWSLDANPPSPAARAVGQIPPPGTRIPVGSTIRLAWIGGDE